MIDHHFIEALARLGAMCLKDLGVVENYGKLNEDVIRDYPDHLQELLLSQPKSRPK